MLLELPDRLQRLAQLDHGSTNQRSSLVRPALRKLELRLIEHPLRESKADDALIDQKTPAPPVSR
jgi:hypothetical protein